MRRPLLSALVQLILAGFVGVTAGTAQSISVLYREPADAFEILDHVSECTPDDLGFLRTFYARFRPRIATMVAQTQSLTEASRVETAATVASPEVGAYLEQVRRLFGVDTTTPFTALYIWWPDTLQRMASPNGGHLLLRVRPAPGETVNSADVVAHEAMHVLASLMPEVLQRDLSAALLDRCTVPGGVRRLAVVEEPIATALGNIEFRRRFMPQRFSWGRRWYGDDWVDMSARLLYPVLTAALADGKPFGAAFGRDAGALCGLLARTRGVPAK